MIASSVPRGAELTSKGQRTRGTIIAAAADLFHRHGSAATTLADVRETAMVSSSQLYHYFGDKQDLVRAVVDHQASVVIENQQAMNLSTVDAFREWKDALTTDEAAMRGQGGCPLGSLGAELAATDPVGRDRVAAGFQRWSRVIELGLANMQHDGTIADDVDTQRLAVAILAALQGGLLMGHVEQNANALDAALDMVIGRLESLTGRTTPGRPAA